jgi:hypothetical protein
MKRQGPAQTQQKTMVTAVAEGSLQRKCACGNHTVAGGECAECAKGENRLQHGKQLRVRHA